MFTDRKKTKRERLQYIHDRLLDDFRSNRTTKGLTRKQIADDCDVSIRQASRDIDTLRYERGAPIKFSFGNNWYCYTHDQFILTEIPFSHEEIISLMLSKRLSTTIPDKKRKRAIDEFLHKVTKDTSTDVDQLKNKVSLKNIHYYRVSPEIFDSCLSGVIHDRKLRIDYFSASRGEYSERIVSPLHLLLYLGNWHLIAYCHNRNERRDFVLSRIRRVEKLEAKVAKKYLSPDIKRKIESHYGIFLGWEKKSVSLRFTGIGANLVRDQIWSRGQKITTKGANEIILEFSVSDYRELIGDILKFGPDVEVIEPPDLRDQIQKAIAGMAKIYSR